MSNTENKNESPVYIKKSIVTASIEDGDEQRLVTGYFTDGKVDASGHIVDSARAREVFREYLEWGNVRDMHGSPVGKVVSAGLDDDNWNKFTVKIIPDNVWELVKNGVYKGFSIGIYVTEFDSKSVHDMDESFFEGVPSAVVKSVREAGQVLVIKDFYISEISIVDRPANPRAVFTEIKSIGSDNLASLPAAGSFTFKATDFPSKGEDSKISLRNSKYPQFDFAYASALKEDYPQIWGKGGNTRGNDAFSLWAKARDGAETDAVLAWIKEREAWAARHYENFRVDGVVAQIKWGVIGSRGQSYMKELINEEKQKIDNKGENTKMEDETTNKGIESTEVENTEVTEVVEAEVVEKSQETEDVTVNEFSEILSELKAISASLSSINTETLVKSISESTANAVRQELATLTKSVEAEGGSDEEAVAEAAVVEEQEIEDTDKLDKVIDEVSRLTKAISGMTAERKSAVTNDKTEEKIEKSYSDMTADEIREALKKNILGNLTV